MASSSSSSSSHLPSGVTREEFNAFHKSDRTLFARLVLNLRRDISNSLQVMSFLLYLEKSGLIRYLIANLVSLPDAHINSMINEVMFCLDCLSYENFSTFEANYATHITLPLITRMTGGLVTLKVIHENRENILVEMNKHLIGICHPAFEDICNEAEIRNKMMVGWEKTIQKMKQLSINNAIHMGELSNQLTTRTRYFDPVDERTVFLTFSKGYPLSEAEVYEYFTRRFGEIIEMINMPKDQVLFAKMVLRSAEMVQEIVTDDEKREYVINGKQVRVRKYIPRNS